jgi:hypothetical protein
LDETHLTIIGQPRPRPPVFYRAGDLQTKGDTKGAIASFEKSLALDPKNQNAAD